MSIQNYPITLSSSFRHQWSMLKKSILAHTCSYSHFWICVSEFFCVIDPEWLSSTIFPLSAITAGSGCHAGGTTMVRHVDTIDQLGSWSKHQQLFLGISNLSKKWSVWFVPHVHMSLQFPMLIFALCQFMIKYFASILFWNYNLVNRKSANMPKELDFQKSQAAWKPWSTSVNTNLHTGWN